MLEDTLCFQEIERKSCLIEWYNSRVSNWIVIFCVEAEERQNNPVTSLRGYSDELVGTKTSTKEVEATFCPAEDNSSLTGNVKHYVTTLLVYSSLALRFLLVLYYLNRPLAAVGLLI